MAQDNDDIKQLQEHWTYLYRERLPQLAQARDPAQEQWPVWLDHCFARIILDNAVGKDRQWTEVLVRPAAKTMNAQQLRSAITLAEAIASGSVSLVELNNLSLLFRSKSNKRPAPGSASLTQHLAKSRKRNDDSSIKSFFPPTEAATKVANASRSFNEGSQVHECASAPDMTVQLERIATSDLTPFQKLALSKLCQIPPGRFSTYQAISDHITRTSHKTCARAIGNAMRNNPFAPDVPCHRVLASDRTLGGFNGAWGEKGAFASQKHELLHDEGVCFDSAGRARGPVFREYK